MSGQAVDLAALHEAMDAGAVAAHQALSGDEEATVLALKQASVAADLAFPGGGDEAAALSAVLAVISEAVQDGTEAGPGEWAAGSACARAEDPGLWFRPGCEDEAKAVCAGCPVRGECLQYALAAPEDHGIWGGLDPEERQLLRDAGREVECGGCGQFKPVTEFSPDGQGGYLGKCRPCRAEAATESRRRRREKYAVASPAGDSGPEAAGSRRQEGEGQ